jgi:PKD repeat protein
MRLVNWPPGSHTVTLNITDSNGQSDTAAQDIFVNSTDQPPTGSFIWGSLDPLTPAQVSFDATASQDVDGQVVNFSWNFGDGTTGSGLIPVHTYGAQGTYPVTLTAIDNAGLTATTCQSITTGGFSGATVQPCQQATKLTYTGPKSVDFSDPGTVSAQLTTADSDQPVADAAITFDLDNAGGSCHGVTNSSGVANCSLIPTIASGPTSINIHFASTAQYRSVQTGAPFNVTAEETRLTITVPSTTALGSQATLSGKLTDDEGTPLSGRGLTFSLGSGTSARTCSTTTSTDGSASCAVTAIQSLGPTVATVSFSGDANYYRGASQEASTIIFAWASHGSFAVGDQSAAGSVTFWGAQWSKGNRLSKGSAPNSFKGFTNGAVVPACGSTWTTTPGNSSGPPPNVPFFMAVVVSSSVGQAGPNISGDVTHVVIVKTDPGYAPNPGHPGTGTVVATLC